MRFGFAGPIIDRSDEYYNQYSPYSSDTILLYKGQKQYLLIFKVNSYYILISSKQSVCTHERL